MSELQIAANWNHVAMDRRPPSVLIIDKSAETREVLRTMLKRDGVATVEAQNASDGLDLAKQCRPHVVVLDTDTAGSSDPSLWGDLGSDSTPPCFVLLGRVSSSTAPLNPSEVVAKPYHYRPLIRKIEELLSPAET